MAIRVGDKVRINNNHDIKSYVGLEGIILEIRPPSRMFKYFVQLPDYPFPFRECCVEKVISIGEQLLFEWAYDEI